MHDKHAGIMVIRTPPLLMVSSVSPSISSEILINKRICGSSRETPLHSLVSGTDPLMGPVKKGSVFFWQRLSDSQLVHPVEEPGTLLDDAFKLACDTGDQLIAREDVCRVDRSPLGDEEIGLDALVLVLDPFYQTAIDQFLHDA
jgi:hypothetical protein